MARKDEIFNSFINHPLIKSKYNIEDSDIPKNLRTGLSSKHTIIKTIALIVESQEQKPAESNNALQKKVIQFLNQEAI